MNALKCRLCSKLPEFPRRCLKCEKRFCTFCVLTALLKEGNETPDKCLNCREEVPYNDYESEESWWRQDAVAKQFRLMEKFFEVGMDENMTGLGVAKRTMTVNTLSKLISR